jgi:HAD superfamily hydrolase (TIGR01509 family)
MIQVFALDFDGVICDALLESILVTWNGYYEKSLADFSNAGLLAIPLSFINRFIWCRKFSRHLGHFFVSLLDPMPPVRDQQAFDAFYQSIQPDDIRRFTQNVSSYRDLARQQKTEQWLSYHRLYPGVSRFLTTVTSPIYIVTAKDAQAVFALLDYAGITFPFEHIYGEQQEKTSALRAIQQREEVKSSEVFFVDDNLPNIMAARQAGYNASWAIWGYNTPDHFLLAQRQAIPSLSLKDFLQLHERTETLERR